MGPLRRTGSFAVAALLAAGCAGPREARRDLSAIQRSGVLRVAVWPGFLSRREGRKLGVDQETALARFSGRLGTRIEWLEARRAEEPFLWLETGRADVAAVRTPPRPGLAPHVVPSAAVGWVDDLLVEGPSRFRGGGSPWLHRSSAAWARLAGGSPARPPALPVPEEVPSSEILVRVARGRYAATVADSALVAGSAYASALRTAGVLTEYRPLVWYVHADARELKAAVDRYLFARHVLRSDSSPPACRDLRAIRRSRRLRLVTTNGPVTCTVAHGGITGFEYELVRRLARSLGVALELEIPPPGHDPVEWLEAGHGDLAALHRPAGGRARRLLRVVGGYRTEDLVAVYRKDGWWPSWVWDLAGRRVAAAGPAAEVLLALGLEPPPELVPLPPGADGLDALAHLARGEAEAAVIGRDLAALELADSETMAAGPAVARALPLAWLFNVESPTLAAVARQFLATAARDGTVAVLAPSLLRPRIRTRSSRLPDIPPYSLTPWDADLKRAALRYGLDWRLLASLMYEESRFDVRAVGPGGSAGLFQFMPATWQWLGITDPFDPHEVIPAAARYLRMLMDDFADAPLPDRIAMAIAAYNVGPRHVEDARRLATRMGLDPNRWRDNVETAMVVLDDPEVARKFPAGVCRCRRAVAYTRRILRRYRLYTEQF